MWLFYRSERVKKAVCAAIFLYILFLILRVANRSSLLERASEWNSHSVKSSDPIQIVLWIWTKNTPAKGLQGRVQRTADKLNADGGEYCRNNFGDSKEWDDLNCQFTLDKKALEEADGVSFSMFNSGYGIDNLPPIRKPHQIWTSFVQESPPHSNWVNNLENLFNWTMSYRADSDVWNPYGRKLKRDKPLPPKEPIILYNVTLENWIAGKTKLVVGAISHCNTPSKRELLIQKMNKSSGGQVDVYGGCGNLKADCSLVNNYNALCGDFWKTISSQYKFFLAFENALCREYVTEKFWRTLEVGMVPVVYGSGFYKAVAPPLSYIDATEFTSATDLMRFLQKVGDNATEYARYFEWIREYTIEQNWNRGFCTMCKLIRDHKLGKRRLERTYPNLKSWWQKQPGTNIPACDKPPLYHD